MYQKILVAMDGSDTAELALKEAVKLAQSSHGRLRLVTVLDYVTVPVDGALTDFAALGKVMRGNAEAALRHGEEIARAAGVEVDSKLVDLDLTGGRVPEAIVMEAGDWPADLIVIGTHGRRGFSRLLMGSVAEGIMRVANRPVLLIRAVTA